MDKTNKSPRPRRSIRDISLTKKDQDTEMAQGASSLATPAPTSSRRTKHLVIENEDEATAPASNATPISSGSSSSYDSADDIEETPSYTPTYSAREVGASAGSAASAAPAAEDDFEDNTPIPAPVAKRAPRTKERKEWQNHVEKAFMSSDDVEGEGDGVDPDDVGNTNKSSHFEPLRSSRRRKGRRIRALIFTVIILAAIFGLMNSVFARVVINIPSATTSLSLVDQALTDEVQSMGITKNSDKKVAIDAVKTVAVSNKATGTIVLYNNYSTEPYDLIKTTRVQTANGSVYRLTEAVTIPGKKGNTPGSVNAKVEAELPGSEYNARGGIDLKLPGLIAGSLKYTQIYAKTSANFTGGSKGSAPDLASAGLNPAIDAAKEEVKADFLATAKAENPDLIILPDSVTVVSSYDSTKIPAAPSNAGADAKTEITVKFTTKAVGLKKDSLKASLETTLGSQNGATMNIPEDALDQLTYKVLETSDDSVKAGLFKIQVSGTAESTFTAELQEKFKTDLAAKPLGTARMLVDEKFPGQDATVKAWPFWMSEVPTDTGKIKIEIGNN